VLLYGLEFGQTERALLENAARNNQPIPDRIVNAPDLLPGLELYYKGFQALNHDRPLGFSGEGAIPWTVMRTYCQEYDIVGEQREYFYLMLKALDIAYLNHMQTKRAAAQPKKE